MSDKELIKQEIEKRLSLLWNLIPEGEKVLKDDFTKEDANNLGKYTELESLLKFIDSLPEEPASEDLEEAADKYALRDSQAYKGVHCTYVDDKIAFKVGAKWQKQKDLEDLFKSDMTMPNKFYEKGKADAMKEMKETLQTEYEKGRFDMREEMMKDAVEGQVVYQIGSAEIVPTDIQYKVVSDRVYIPNVKLGDKVKIIICKNKQQ